MIGFASSRTGQILPLEFTLAGEVRNVTLPHRVTVTDTETYTALARLGFGLIQVPRHRYEQDLAAGVLVEVMPDHPPAPTPISVLYPRNRSFRRACASSLIGWSRSSRRNYEVLGARLCKTFYLIVCQKQTSHRHGGQTTRDRARQLETKSRSVRACLNVGEPISNPNPLGNALALLIGAGAAALTVWQQAVVAGVFGHCLVGVMVIFELLGQVKVRPMLSSEIRALRTETAIGADKLLPSPSSIRPKVGATARNAKDGGLKAFVLDRLYPGEGVRTETKALMEDYRPWCAQNGRTALDLSRFLDEIVKICRQAALMLATTGASTVLA